MNFSRRALVGIVLGLTLLIPSTFPVQAAAIAVNTTHMTVADDGKCSLVEAIIAAETDTSSGVKPGECPAGNGADTILLQQATYTLTEVYDDAFIPLGLPMITSDVTIEGGHAVIQRANNAPEFSLLAVWKNTSKLTMKDVTLRGGRTSGDAVGPALLLATDATATLTNVQILENISHHTGASWTIDASVYVSDATLIMIDSVIADNTGEHANGMLAYGSTITLNNTTISGHTEKGIIVNNTTLALWESSLTGNGKQGLTAEESDIQIMRSGIYSNQDGGVDLYASTMTMDESRIQRNIVSEGNGNLAGGMAIRSGSIVTLTNTTISGNDDYEDPPPCPCVIGNDAVAVRDSSLSVSNSLIEDDGDDDNRDTTLDFDGGDLRLFNSTVSGSGPYQIRLGGAKLVAIVFSTIASDFDYSFGPTAFNNSGTAARITISNSIVQGCWRSVGNGSHGYNIEPTTTCGFKSTGDKQNVPFDTLWTPLQDNGGPTKTHALSADSEAIDMIPANVNDCKPGESVDQRGALRAGGAGKGGLKCDCGAYEAASNVRGPATPTLFLPLYWRK